MEKMPPLETEVPVSIDELKSDEQFVRVHCSVSLTAVVLEQMKDFLDFRIKGSSKLGQSQTKTIKGKTREFIKNAEEKAKK